MNSEKQSNGGSMDKIDKIKRDIATLWESIQLDNEDIANLHLSGTELNGVLAHIRWCMTELRNLEQALESELEKQEKDA